MSGATIKSTTEKIIILCFTINILLSFAESRQIEAIAWKLFALLATAVSVVRKLPYVVCALPSGRERQKGVFWQLFRPKKLPSGAAAIRCIKVPKAQLVIKSCRVPSPLGGGLLPIVAIRTDHTPTSFKDLQRKTIKPRKKSSDFFRKGETKENPQGGVNAAAGFELVSTRSSREDCLANLLGFAFYPNALRRAIAREGKLQKRIL